jgi:hypothetical protein
LALLDKLLHTTNIISPNKPKGAETKQVESHDRNVREDFCVVATKMSTGPESFLRIVLNLVNARRLTQERLTGYFGSQNRLVLSRKERFLSK